MKNLDLYWKPIINKSPCKQFSTAHIVSLAIILFIIILVYLFRDVLKKKKYEKIFSHTVGVILILHQISIYFWYIDNDKLCLKEVLPLYMVRPDRAYILAGGNPVKVRFSKPLCIESWRCYGNVTF